MQSSIVEILEKLISFASITPADLGCQAYMVDYLRELGFVCQNFDNPPVYNFFARLGTQAPLLVFAGHTDVVPIGNRENWQSEPFKLTIKDDMAFGRGTADMKGSLAAMMQAAQQFVSNNPNFAGSIGFLITSGEEGDLFNQGTPYVMEKLYQQKNFHIDYCIVGEPSSTKALADTIKIGRRGSLTGKLILKGIQGHVAYPHLANNPIHLLSPVLAELTSTVWDQGNTHFPPTSFQIIEINAGGEAGNVIPGIISMQFNFRFSTEQTAEGLQDKIQACFQRHQLKPEISWLCNGEPFLTAQGRLLEITQQAITETLQYIPILSTSGGTSDGRFIAPYGIEIIELGPINKTIHQVDECVSLDDLEYLARIYYLILVKIFSS